MESSLDRFARTRGAALLGASAMGRQWKIQTVIGGVFLGIAAIVVGAAFVSHQPEVAFGALGPFLAGTINTTVGLGFKKQSLQNAATVSLSEEALCLLRALVARAEVWQGGWRPRHSPMVGPHAWPRYKAPAEPFPSAMEALDRAAEAFNRVADALGDAKDERSSRLRSAADAGMGEALHLAATGRGNDQEIERVVARMDELAGLVESSMGMPEAVSALRSNLEATLEELRAENEARQELKG